MHFYDASDGERLLGGLHQNGSITEANFLDMLDFLLVTHSPVRVQDRFSCHEVARTAKTLEPGMYDVRCKGSSNSGQCLFWASCAHHLTPGPIKLTDEPWLPRLVTHSASTPDDTFSNSVRTRDGKCVISGPANPISFHEPTGTEATHIFPRDNEDCWVEYNLARHVTDMDGFPDASKLSSAQNGLLLGTHIRQLWDQCVVSVNPDVSRLPLFQRQNLNRHQDNYKVVVFGLDMHGLDGRTLGPACRDPSDPHRVSDALLRWHYRQCVLANVRGEGEPIFDGISPGADAIQEMEDGPYAKERFEMEMSARLRGFDNGD